MSVQEINELQQREEQRELNKIAGKPQHIQINERTLESYREEFGKKGLTVQSEEPQFAQDVTYHIIAK